MNLALRLHLLLFPSACHHCRRWMNPLAAKGAGFPFLCPGCHAGLGWKLPERTCRRCGRAAAEAGRVRCPGCADETMHLDGVLAVCRYSEPVEWWIKALKYRRHDALGPLLGHVVASAPILSSESAREAMAQADVALPVPLHPRRMRSRGFNQSHLLAYHSLAALGRRGLSAPALRTDLLRRHRHTRPQVEMSGRERYENVADAFSLTPAPRARAEEGDGVPSDSRVAGRNLLLVDDVMTTGATLNACAQALKAAGAHTVTALVLARM